MNKELVPQSQNKELIVASTELPQALLVKENTLVWAWLNDKSENSKIIYERAIRGLFKFSKKTVLEIKTEDVSNYIFKYLEGLSRSSQQIYLSAISSFYLFCIKSEYSQINPCLAISRPFVDRTEKMRVPDEQQMKQLFEKTENVRDRLICKLLYYAALRVEELVKTEWKHFKVREHDVKLTVIGKGSKVRFIVIGKDFFDELQILKADGSKYVFRSNRKSGNHISVRRVEELVKIAGRNAKLSIDLHPHAFRHGHATIALRKGANLRLIQETLGHSSVSTTEIYTHIDPDESSGSYL